MKIKIEENLCIIKPPVTHSTMQYKILYSVCTLHFCTSALLHIFHTFALLHIFHTFALLHFCIIALLHYCTCALLHFCTYFTILSTYTTICKAGHILLCWLMIIRVKKKILGVQARMEYAHTFAHFHHRRCANMQMYECILHIVQ